MERLLHAVGFDAWDSMALEIGSCHVAGNGEDADRELADAADGCSRGDPGLGDLAVPAGPDGIFFTDDDPWVAAAGGARP